jgi:DNA polymerase-3 subunit alpha
MEIARMLGAYTPGDADILRKAMGKKLPEEMAEQRMKFLKGARENKVAPKIAAKIFDIMEKFAGYGFNKSHSAAYALIAYHTAYLKAHYPVAFMAALLTSDMGDTDKVIKYIGECREMGIEVLPPDVNESSRDFTVVGDKVRFGLAAVKNVGTASIESILATREEGCFESLVDFLGRVDSRRTNKKVVESLIKCGAFDSTGTRRAQLFESLATAMEVAQGVQRDREQGQISIFAGLSKESAPPAMVLPDIEEWPEKEKLNYEKEALGFYITGHPLLKYSKELALYASVDTESIKGCQNEATINIGGMVGGVKEIKTRRGARMAFLNLEDLKGNVEVIIFADLFATVNCHLTSTSPLMVTGRVDRDEERVKVIASDIYPLEEAEGRVDRKVHIVFKKEVVGVDGLNELKRVVMSNTGNSPVYLHIIESDGVETVVALPEDMKIKATDGLISSIKGIAPDIEVRFV